MAKPVDLKLNLLVLRAQAGDELAFKDLYQRFCEGSLRFLQSIVKGEEAEDLNQEVWISVYQRIASLSNAAGFKIWLFQITRNKALDNYRNSKRMKEFHDMLKLEAEEISEYEESDFQMQNNDLLQEALLKISPIRREAIVLNYFEGMDYQEISLIMGCSVGTVRSRIHHAKKKIKEILNSNIYNYEQS